MQWHHKFTQAHQQHATWNVSTHRDGFIEGPKKDAFSISASPGQCCAVCNSRVNLWIPFLLPPMLITAPTLQLQSRKSQQKALKRWHSFLRITATPYCCTRNGFQHKPEVRHSLWPSPAQGWACPTGLGCCTGTWVDTHSPGLFLHRALCRTQAAVLMMDIQTHRKICYPLKATFCMPRCMMSLAPKTTGNQSWFNVKFHEDKQTWSEKPNPTSTQDFTPTLHSARPTDKPAPATSTTERWELQSTQATIFLYWG